MLILLSACAPAPAPPPPPPANPWADAAAMDKRTPIPLTPMMAEHQKGMMRDHLAAVAQIGLARIILLQILQHRRYKRSDVDFLPARIGEQDHSERFQPCCREPFLTSGPVYPLLPRGKTQWASLLLKLPRQLPAQPTLRQVGDDRSPSPFEIFCQQHLYPALHDLYRRLQLWSGGEEEDHCFRIATVVRVEPRLSGCQTGAQSLLLQLRACGLHFPVQPGNLLIGQLGREEKEPNIHEFAVGIAEPKGAIGSMLRCRRHDEGRPQGGRYPLLRYGTVAMPAGVQS